MPKTLFLSASIRTIKTQIMKYLVVVLLLIGCGIGPTSVLLGDSVVTTNGGVIKKVMDWDTARIRDYLDSPRLIMLVDSFYDVLIYDSLNRLAAYKRNGKWTFGNPGSALDQTMKLLKESEKHEHALYLDSVNTAKKILTIQDNHGRQTINF